MRGVAANQLLKQHMVEAGFTQEELAEAVNAALRAAGYDGTVSDRTVRNWLAGRSRWPHRRQRAALETVFDCPIRALGFVPRQRESVRAADAERASGSILRRSFVVASAGVALTTAVAPAPAVAGASPSVGTSDVIRLRDSIDALSAIDDKRGGHDALKRAALAGAAEALELQRRSTTQRVRTRLFALASDFTATAAWSLIDAGQLASADRHLDRALTLAGMAQNPEMTMRVWNLRSMLARQREAVAAGQAAQSTWAARRSRLHRLARLRPNRYRVRAHRGSWRRSAIPRSIRRGNGPRRRHGPAADLDRLLRPGRAALHHCDRPRRRR